jgi:hypothetical protein
MSETHGLETLDFLPSMRQTMVITSKSVETGGEVSRVEVDLEVGQTGPPAQSIANNARPTSSTTGRSPSPLTARPM